MSQFLKVSLTFTMAGFLFFMMVLAPASCHVTDLLLRTVSFHKGITIIIKKRRVKEIAVVTIQLHPSLSLDPKVAQEGFKQSTFR